MEVSGNKRLRTSGRGAHGMPLGIVDPSVVQAGSWDDAVVLLVGAEALQEGSSSGDDLKEQKVTAVTVDNLEDEDGSLIALPAGRAEGISPEMMSDTALIRAGKGAYVSSTGSSSGDDLRKKKVTAVTVDNLVDEDGSLIALPAGRAEGISSEMMFDAALIRAGKEAYVSSVAGTSSGDDLRRQKVTAVAVDNLEEDMSLVASPGGAKEQALAWLSHFDDGQSSSFAIVEESTGGKKNNKAIPRGSLRQPECLPVWKYCLDVIRESQGTSHAGADGLPLIDCDMVWRYVTEGISPPFAEGYDGIPPHTQKNYVKFDDSPEARWITHQVLAWLESDSIRLEDFAGEATNLLPLFTVEKDGGEGLRLILDAQFVNKFFLKKKFRLMTLSKARHSFFDLMGFDSIDLSASFNHLELHKDYVRYFGFEWGGVRYVSTCALYGASPVPEILQVVASVGVRTNNTIGLSPLLLTAEDWRQLARGEIPLPSSHDRYSADIQQYLDDFGKLWHRHVRSAAGRLVTGAELVRLIPKLSQSFQALMEALGFVISPKSQRNPFAVNKFLGFNIITALDGGCFGIPVKKVDKNVRRFKAALALSRWTLKQVAQLASCLLQFILIWGRQASLLARPFYHELALRVTSTSSWTHMITPTPLMRDMVYEAIGLLEGEEPILQAPVINTYRESVRLWESEDWRKFDRDGRTPVTVMVDAGSYAEGGWATIEPIDELCHTLEQNILRDGDKLSFWAQLTIQERVDHITATDDIVYSNMLLVEERTTSSTYRELLAISRFYSDSSVMEKLLLRLQSTGERALLHVTDSQATRNIMTNGASKSRDCHRLVLSIWRTTRVLRERFGLVFGWLSREALGAQVADAFSKPANWTIRSKIFWNLDKEFNFNLDAYSSPTERVTRADGTLLPFCSRETHQDSLGDGRSYSWNGHTVWAFPPPVDMLIQQALIKCTGHVGTAVLCLPGWLYHRHRTRLRSCAWKERRTLPAHSAKKISRGPTREKNELTYMYSNFVLILLIFVNDNVHEAGTK